LPKAILFDLDGTLVDSEPWHKKAELQVFNQLGLAVTAEDIGHYVGITMPKMLEDLHLRFGKRISLEEFIEAEMPILSEYIAIEMSVFEDVPAFLLSLNEKRMAVVTSSVTWYVEAIRKRFSEIEPAFQVLVCESDVKIGKPDPEPYLLAANRVGFQPAACLVLEDSVNGVRSGVAAGCTVIGVDRENLGHLGEAHRVVRSLNEIGALL